MQIQVAINEARAILQDTDSASGYRYSDADLLGYVRDAVNVARALRPDIFIGQYATPVPETYALSDPFPLPLFYYTPTCQYIAGRAELRDDEFAVDGRAMTFAGRLESVLVKGA